MVDHCNAPFKARARLLLLLGEQLITDEVTAVFELIKNSYDADATQAKVVLQDISNQDKGVIKVIDNGIGMNISTGISFAHREIDLRYTSQIHK